MDEEEVVGRPGVYVCVGELRASVWRGGRCYCCTTRQTIWNTESPLPSMKTGTDATKNSRASRRGNLKSSLWQNLARVSQINLWRQWWQWWQWRLWWWWLWLWRWRLPELFKVGIQLLV